MSESDLYFVIDKSTGKRLSPAIPLSEAETRADQERDKRLQESSGDPADVELKQYLAG